MNDKKKFPEKEYRIEISETLSKAIKINTKSKSEAFAKVKTEYYDEKHVLTSDDYVETKFKLLCTVSRDRGR